MFAYKVQMPVNNPEKSIWHSNTHFTKLNFADVFKLKTRLTIQNHIPKILVTKLPQAQKLWLVYILWTVWNGFNSIMLGKLIERYFKCTNDTHIYMYTCARYINGMIVHSMLLMQSTSCDVLLPVFIHRFSTGTNANLIGKVRSMDVYFVLSWALTVTWGSIGHTVSLRFLIFNWFCIKNGFP
jgi:hypothetical protein